MNIREKIRKDLESEGCRIVDEVGIWTVTTPTGEKWDFTVPQRTTSDVEEADDLLSDADDDIDRFTL